MFLMSLMRPPTTKLSGGEALPTSILFEYISTGRDVFKTPGTQCSLGWLGPSLVEVIE